MAKRAKFMVYIDDGDYSRVALRFACYKAKTLGWPVEMLYVLEPADFSSIGAVEEMMRKERREKAEQVLSQLAEEAYGFAEVTPSLIVKEGRAEDQVLAAIKDDNDINALVIGTAPGQKGISKNRLVAWIVSQLGDKLHIPVLVIPGDLSDEQIKEMS